MAVMDSMLDLFIYNVFFSVPENTGDMKPHIVAIKSSLLQDLQNASDFLY